MSGNMPDRALSLGRAMEISFSDLPQAASKLIEDEKALVDLVSPA
jgi:hypothetical protein